MFIVSMRQFPPTADYHAWQGLANVVRIAAFGIASCILKERPTYGFSCPDVATAALPRDGFDKTKSPQPRRFLQDCGDFLKRAQ
jgi:hypothetical protein